MRTLGALCREGIDALRDAGIESASVDAKVLLFHVTGLDAAGLLVRRDDPVSAQHASEFETLIDQRARNHPVAHIVGMREFWSLPFKVTPDTLIPRPDTETLVDLATTRLRNHPPATCLDIGTGSGCILIAILREFPLCHGVGTDVSTAVLDVARHNARENSVTDRVEFHFTAWDEGVEGQFDLIVSNPPYIPTPDIDGLAPDVRDFEPIGALDGGNDGLDAYRSILPRASRRLKDDGLLILEIGVGQSDDVINLADALDLTLVELRHDLSRIPRAVAFQKKSIGNPGLKG